MKNPNNTAKDQKEDNKHPTPNEDPGAEIETVIPSAEKELAPAENTDTGTAVSTENHQKNAVDDSDQADGDDTGQEEGTKSDDSTESGAADEEIETVSP